jgi:hypothetical protein
VPGFYLTLKNAIAISQMTAGGEPCQLTPTNGGAYCPQPLASGATLTATLTSSSYLPNNNGCTLVGAPPTAAGTTTCTGPAAPPATSDCKCVRLTDALEDFKVEHAGYVSEFFLKWRMTCQVGTSHQCLGQIHLNKLPTIAGLHWVTPKSSPFKKLPGGDFVIDCGHGSTCEQTVSGEEKFELIAHAAARANKRIELSTETHGCPPQNKETFTIQFDAHGNLDYQHSHLGRV